MKKSKYQEYFHCFIVCILVPDAFWFNHKYIVTVPVSATLRGVALVKGMRLFQCGYSKVRRLLKSSAHVRPGAFLEEICYAIRQF